MQVRYLHFYLILKIKLLISIWLLIKTLVFKINIFILLSLYLQY